MINTLGTIKISKQQYIFIAIGFIIALLTGLYAVYSGNYAMAFVPVLILGITVYLILLFREPFIGIIITITYCFFYAFLSREIGGGFQYGLGIDMLLLLTLLSIWYNANRYNIHNLNNNLIYITLAWFAISFAEIANPSGASPRGWLQEIRGAALYPLLIVPIGIILFDSRKKLNFFLGFIIVLSLLATFIGIKQVKMGLSIGEQTFIDDAGYVTHLINDQLRAFSVFTDASQFGPQQAHVAVITFILAIGLQSWNKKILLIAISVLSFYGMLISGTRGAFFVILAGALVGILFTKNLRVIIFGGSIFILLFIILKFTYIGNTNYNIYRLRSSLDTEDASLNVRLINQQKLRDYLATKPFGEGLGVIGHWGREYNPDKYLSTIPPDSYWVKVWAMYGIVGFIIFFCMWMFIFGYAGAMIWKIPDKNLRLKLGALLGGAFGIFISSYGNEVMNTMPSSIVLSLSIAIIYITCKLYKQNKLI